MEFLKSAWSILTDYYPMLLRGVGYTMLIALTGTVLGLVIGLLFSRKKDYSRVYLLVCLAISMLSGRVVWGIAKAVLLGVAGKPFGLEAFLVGGFADAVPGLILQFVLIPLIMEVIYRSRIGRVK